MPGWGGPAGEQPERKELGLMMSCRLTSQNTWPFLGGGGTLEVLPAEDIVLTKALTLAFRIWCGSWGGIRRWCEEAHHLFSL